MGIKKEAPSLFCFGMSHQALPTAQCSGGALICFDLAHIIEVERVIGLDYQLVLPVFLDVKGVPLVIVGELPVLWMLRNVVFVTEKRSHTSKLQNTLGSVHDGDLVLRHQFFATMSSDEFKNGQKNSPSPGRRRTIMLLFSCHLDFSHKIISNPDFLFLFPINFWDFTSQNMAN
jgi:hypothetical protein